MKRVDDECVVTFIPEPISLLTFFLIILLSNMFSVGQVSVINSFILLVYILVQCHSYIFLHGVQYKMKEIVIELELC